MSFRQYKLRWSFIILVLLVVAGLFIAGLYRLTFDTDLAASLPQDDPVLADARRIIANHPIQDRVVIDVALPRADPEGLIRAAALIEQRLRESGLFRRIGLAQEQQRFPELIFTIAERLPVLFSATELEEKVRPLLLPEKIRETISAHFAQLGQLESIGQTALISRDPLNLRQLILSRMADLAPTKNAQFHQGQLISADRKHLLIIAVPWSSGADTAFSRKLTALLDRIDRELKRSGGPLASVTLTPVGTYRAALDNEISTKQGMERAVIFSTIGIFLLLLVAFPRPAIGLLALLPSVAGTMLALFVYSLLHPSISMMAVGFGGAVISFTVDYGIAYLLFLDRRHETCGMEATREVWSLGLLAMLTTAVSFAFLFISGFSALAQIGEFTALGVLFTYIFVHAIYPVIFPLMPPARRDSLLPIMAFAGWIASTESKGKLYAAVALAVLLLFFARPVFRVDLAAMNSVSPETLAAEKMVSDVWGNILGRIYVMVEGRDLNELQRRSDNLTARLEQEARSGVLAPGFSPSAIFPGAERSAENLKSWQAFWNPRRAAELRDTIRSVSRELGFTPDAFDPFMNLVATREMAPLAVPESFFGLMGISRSRDSTFWLQVSSLTPGPAYQGAALHDRFQTARLGALFDPTLFAERLADLLLSGFIKMTLIVGAVTIAVAFLYLLDWQLTLLGLLPTLFALICTLGTLNLLGQPLGIPTIMVAVVVIGMGSDYALYLVRAHQRYWDNNHPSLTLIRLSIFLSFATTFMGFGVLALSGHALLKSAGIALALGIGYSFIGAVAITPPLLKRVLASAPWKAEKVVPGSRRHRLRTLRRYSHMEPYPRLFARFKIRFDPMFPRLADYLVSPRNVIDIGCGYGVPAVWLLALYPDAKVYGIDPDCKRVAVAERAMGGRGTAEAGGAPDLPLAAPEQADTVLMLDMIHHLSDDALHLALRRIRERLEPGGRLILRATIPAWKRPSRLRRLEMWRLRAAKATPHYRSVEEIGAHLGDAGLTVKRVEPADPNREEMWFIAERAALPGRKD